MGKGNGSSKDSNRRRALQVMATFSMSLLMITGSLLYASSRQDAYREVMEPFDAAVDLVEQVNDMYALRGADYYGRRSDCLVLSKQSLEWYAKHPSYLEGRFTSPYHYRITFDDLDVDDAAHDPVAGMSSSYTFGEVPPRGADIVSVSVHYALHIFSTPTPHIQDDFPRHVCLMTVEVWP